ncbi:hypothetical protein [Zoogloea sp.]|uniref:hypothetical protein n=1 Tax=Zoogloea sp. TaxID=49181 RepID=UPI0026155C25|nr:hypothetical protein [uncultured Zoogloea sp.]
MTTFFWVPFDDSDWNHDVYCRSIPAHGKILPHADGSVGFVGHENVSWSQVQANFAQAIRACLGDGYGQQISYRLLACFGANNITPLAHSFGSKLAAEMGKVGLKGSLTAYKGATGMDANLGKQIGSSRITCALSVLRHLGTLVGSHPTDDASEVWQL